MMNTLAPKRAQDSTRVQVLTPVLVVVVTSLG